MTQKIEDVSARGQQTTLGIWSDVGLHRFGASVSSADGGGVVRLVLSGDIDLAVRDRLRDIVQARIASPDVKALLIDLAAVTFLDCGGVGVLIAGRRLAADVGCGYRVVNATGIVALILDLTGVLPLLELGVGGAEDGTRADVPRQRQSGLG